MYKYLFPYSQVPSGSRIVIYGIGEVGMDYYKQMLVTGFCDVVAIIDRKWDEYQNLKCPVYPHEKLGDISCDYIVLAFKTSIHLREIVNTIKSYGVSDEQIIIPTANDAEASIYGEVETEEDLEALAYTKSRLSVAFTMKGGIGDCISNAPLVYMLVRELPDCLIDLVGVKNKGFLEYLFQDCRNINVITKRIVDDQGYALSMEVLRGNVVVAQLKDDIICEKNNAFYEKLKKVQKKNKAEDFDYRIPLQVFWKRFELQGQDYYSAKTCDGILDLNRNVPIPLSKAGQKEFEDLRLLQYITVCGGNGLSKDKSIVSKAWPKEYFDELIRMIKASYPNIQVVQIGAADVEVYQNTDIKLLGKDFEVISWILKNSLLHIDIDGGMVHLASQLGTKCIVLFGPTSVKYLGYKDNINIVSKKCNSCYGLYSENYRCARFMDEPECMYSIRPEMVFEKVRDYLEFVM